LPLSAGNLSKTPSPNEFVGKKGGSKPSDKKAAKGGNEFVAICRFNLPPFAAAVIHTAAVMKEAWQFCVRHLP